MGHNKNTIAVSMQSSQSVCFDMACPSAKLGPNPVSHNVVTT